MKIYGNIYPNYDNMILMNLLLYSKIYSLTKKPSPLGKGDRVSGG